MSCSHPDRFVETETQQLNENSRQRTRTCIRCGIVVENKIVEVRQW